MFINGTELPWTRKMNCLGILSHQERHRNMEFITIKLCMGWCTDTRDEIFSVPIYQVQCVQKQAGLIPSPDCAYCMPILWTAQQLIFNLVCFVPLSMESHYPYIGLCSPLSRLVQFPWRYNSQPHFISVPSLWEIWHSVASVLQSERQFT